MSDAEKLKNYLAEFSGKSSTSVNIGDAGDDESETANLLGWAKSGFGNFVNKASKIQENIPLPNPLRSSDGGSSWLSEAESDPFCPKLSKKQRILGFMGCMGMGLLCFMMAAMYLPVLIVSARKFALLYTLGSLFFISSFSLLYGPKKHFKVYQKSIEVFERVSKMQRIYARFEGTDENYRGCLNCGYFTEIMIRVEESVFCYLCKPDDVNDGRVQASFYQCEAKFICEIGGCDATATDFLLGTCCDRAKKKIASDSLEYQKVVGSYFESWKKVEADAVERHRRAQIVEARLKEEVDIVKINREKYKKATTEAFKEAAMEVDGIKIVTNDEFEQKFQCGACWEKYDKEERYECTLTCGHRFCHQCLDLMTPKSCPNCRKKFNKTQIIKLY